MTVERTSILLDLLRWEQVLAPTTLKRWVCPGMRCQEAASWAQHSVPATPLSIASVVVGTHLAGPRDVGLSLAVPSTFSGTRSISLAWHVLWPYPWERKWAGWLGVLGCLLGGCVGPRAPPHVCLGHRKLFWLPEDLAFLSRLCLHLGAYFPHEGVALGSSSCLSWVWGRRPHAAHWRSCHAALHSDSPAGPCFWRRDWEPCRKPTTWAFDTAASPASVGGRATLEPSVKSLGDLGSAGHLPRCKGAVVMIHMSRDACRRAYWECFPRTLAGILVSGARFKHRKGRHQLAFSVFILNPLL